MYVYIWYTNVHDMYITMYAILRYIYFTYFLHLYVDTNYGKEFV